MKTVLIVFGTRPEAIKMCPVITALRAGGIRTSVLITSQHRELTREVIELFGISPDYDLDIMESGQTPISVSGKILLKIESILDELCPELVLVHGDTSTAFAAGYAAFLKKIPVCHIEAGLRTEDIFSPHPEEFNRRAIGLISSYDFAPTEGAAAALIREGKPSLRIYLTGNTVLDALEKTVKKQYTHPLLEELQGRRLVLITAHRRESQGDIMYGMLEAIKRVFQENPALFGIYPVHPGGMAHSVAYEVLSGFESIRLTEPMSVYDFHNLMARSYFIITDSGGVQEEAPALGVPVLIMRDVTERTEGIEAGSSLLIGRAAEGIYKSITALIRDPDRLRAMSQVRFPFGEPGASQKIADIIAELLK